MPKRKVGRPRKVKKDTMLKKVKKVKAKITKLKKKHIKEVKKALKGCGL